MHLTPWILALSLLLTSCASTAPSPKLEETGVTAEAQLATEQILAGQEGDIHYSY